MSGDIFLKAEENVIEVNFRVFYPLVLFRSLFQYSALPSLLYTVFRHTTKRYFYRDLSTSTTKLILTKREYPFISPSVK